MFHVPASGAIASWSLSSWQAEVPRDKLDGAWAVRSALMTERDCRGCRGCRGLWGRVFGPMSVRARKLFETVLLSQGRALLFFFAIVKLARLG